MLESISGVEIAVIGGSGLLNLDNLKVVETPNGTKIAFLALPWQRPLSLTPRMYPAELTLLPSSTLGQGLLLLFSAVGSLRQEIPPKDFVLPDQIIDRTKGIRPSSFFEKGAVGHVSFEEALENKTLESVKALENSSAFAVMTAKPQRCPEAMKKLAYILPNINN
ncbi:hypothetical protein BSLG_005909 [Batrachochytrium salamandrivorans]|nr:hypothetical protein BSLG_005909 [Batrachochytrium salamandrivorans]